MTAGVTAGRVLHRTGKSLVTTGTYKGVPVIVKTITTDDAYWVGCRRRELAACRWFGEPEVLWADDRVMVLRALPGARLHEQRHLDSDPDAAVVRAVLATLRQVATRTPPPGPEPADPVAECLRRIERDVADDDARRRLRRLVDQVGGASAFAHGDPIPTNILLHDGAAALVDWELCGRFLPGYDLAVLFTVGAAAPTLAAAVEAEVRERGLTLPFTVNLGLLLRREIRMHRALPAGPVRARRLAALDRQLTAWHHRLRAVT